MVDSCSNRRRQGHQGGTTAHAVRAQLEHAHRLHQFRLADAEIFETTVYDFTTLSRRFQEMAFLNKGLTIILRDERPDVHIAQMLELVRRAANGEDISDDAGDLVLELSTKCVNDNLETFLRD